jgi:uncharacterized protein
MRGSRRGYVDVVKLLLDYGADTEKQDQYGATALIMAAAEGHLPVVQELLSRGANMRATDRNGWTALMWASSVRHKDVVDLLREYEKRKSVESA